MYQRCSHILSAEICPVVPENRPSGDGTESAAGSGVLGLPEITPSEDNQHDDYKGYGIARCRHWGLLALRDPVTGSVPGTPPGQVTNPGWRGGRYDPKREIH